MSDDLQVYGRRKGKHRVVRKSDYKGDVLSPADRKAMAAALKAAETRAAWFGAIASVLVGLFIGAQITPREASVLAASVPYIYTSDVEPTTTHKF